MSPLSFTKQINAMFIHILSGAEFSPTHDCWCHRNSQGQKEVSGNCLRCYVIYANYCSCRKKKTESDPVLEDNPDNSSTLLQKSRENLLPESKCGKFSIRHDEKSDKLEDRSSKSSRNSLSSSKVDFPSSSAAVSFLV